jgi:putative peptidoglycan lipid II flippase
MEDTPKRMMRAATSFFSGTMLSRVTGMLRDISMAFAFGTDPALAAFFVAFRFAHLLRRLFGEGILQTVFTPHFENMRKDKSSSEHAAGFFIDLYAILSLLLVFLVGSGMAICGAILGGYLGSWSVGAKEIAYLALLMLPSLLFICLAALNTSLLQCERSYFLPSVSPVAFNVIWILGVVSLRDFTPSEAMPYLALCIVVACFFQWLATLPKVISILRNIFRSTPFSKRIKSANIFSGDVKRLWKPFVLGIIGIGAAQFNSLFDSLFATYADSAGPAYLWYAIRLQQLPLALFGIALSGALLPPLTRAIAAGDQGRSHLLFEAAINRAFILIVPMTAMLFLFARRSIDLLYGRGDFTLSSIEGTTQCLWGYGAGLLPMTLVLIMAPVFYAGNNYRIPSMAAVVSVIVNIVLNGLFVLAFGWGAFSIALGTSLSAWINMIILGAAMDSSMQKVLCTSIWEAVRVVAVPLSLATVVTFFVLDVMSLEGSFFVKGLSLGALTLIFSVVYFFSLPRNRDRRKLVIF